MALINPHINFNGGAKNQKQKSRDPLTQNS